MNSNAKDLGMTKKRIYSDKAEDGILPLGGVTNPRRKRARLPWVLVVLFSVLCVLVSPLKSSTVWSTSLIGSVADASGKQTVENPTETGTGLTGNGRTNDVLWDKYSLVLKGQRVFIQYVHSLLLRTLCVLIIVACQFRRVSSFPFTGSRVMA